MERPVRKSLGRQRRPDDGHVRASLTARHPGRSRLDDVPRRPEDEKNGPEWFRARTVTGSCIRSTPGRTVTNNSRIGLAQLGADGVWRGGYLGRTGQPEKRLTAAWTKNDPAPRITYVDNKENHYWREVFNPATEDDHRTSRRRTPHPPRPRSAWSPYPLTVDGVDQAFYRDLDSGVVTQLTFDAGIGTKSGCGRRPSSATNSSS